MSNYSKIGRGWRVIGNHRIYARSKWEANFARWLDYRQKLGDYTSWAHEPRTFWFSGIKRGCVSYLPDFQVFTSDGSWFYEVKGRMDAKSHTKIKRFRKYFPEEKLIIIDAKWFRDNGPRLKLIIKDWE